MVDQNFYKKNGNFKLGYLAPVGDAKLHDEKDSEVNIFNVASLSEAGEGDITFLQNTKYIESFKNTKASACIVSSKYAELAPKGLALLISENPYYTYAKIAEKFYHRENIFTEISELASVDDTVTIGNRTRILPGAYIGPNCKIGSNCLIHANVKITNAIIGDNVIIHSNSSIGQDGFGYALHKGRHYKVPQLGRVIIENDVEIGANTTIDRGAGPDTIIGEGTKIDNLVQIGHNCKIGKHCIIVSQVGISGSTEIGDYTVLAGQVGIAGHLKIGSQVQVAAKAGLMKDVGDKEVVAGYPAMPVKDWHRQTIVMKNLINRKNGKDE